MYENSYHIYSNNNNPFKEEGTWVFLYDEREELCWGSGETSVLIDKVHKNGNFTIDITGTQQYRPVFYAQNLYWIAEPTSVGGDYRMFKYHVVKAAYDVRNMELINWCRGLKQVFAPMGEPNWDLDYDLARAMVRYMKQTALNEISYPIRKSRV